MNLKNEPAKSTTRDEYSRQREQQFPRCWSSYVRVDGRCVAGAGNWEETEFIGCKGIWVVFSGQSVLA
jgi:hypothetical protein